jgi:hypothetical protein
MQIWRCGGGATMAWWPAFMGWVALEEADQAFERERKWRNKGS